MRQGLVNLLLASALITIFIGSSATAAPVKDPIRVHRSASYLDDTVGTPEIRSSCSWNTRLIRQWLVDRRNSPLSAMPIYRN